jgi:antirestriction protein ArdC
LVAEFAAAFLCQESGITNTLDNSTAYITGWAKKIGSDKTLLVHAASQAQKAFEYILGQAS